MAFFQKYRGPVTDHFDGKRFYNTPRADHRVRDLFRWISTRKPGSWPAFRHAEPGPPPPKRVDGEALRVTFVNHTTVLLQVDGLNILTDPVWSERVGPVAWAGPRRRRPPGLRMEDLPPLDLILLSHDHFDHLDVPTLKALLRSHNPRVVAPLGNRSLLERTGFKQIEIMDWWDSIPLKQNHQLHCVPAQHFSGRSLMGRDATLWAGFVLDSPGGAIFFAGDTGFGPHIDAIGARFDRFRLALIPIGAFRPEWFMGPVHISPNEALTIHRKLNVQTSVATHFGTFPLADDGEADPINALDEALAALPEPKPRFWVLDFGEGREVPALDFA